MSYIVNSQPFYKAMRRNMRGAIAHLVHEVLNSDASLSLDKYHLWKLRSQSYNLGLWSNFLGCILVLDQLFKANPDARADLIDDGFALEVSLYELASTAIDDLRP